MVMQIYLVAKLITFNQPSGGLSHTSVRRAFERAGLPWHGAAEVPPESQVDPLGAGPKIPIMQGPS